MRVSGPVLPPGLRVGQALKLQPRVSSLKDSAWARAFCFENRLQESLSRLPFRSSVRSSGNFGSIRRRRRRILSLHNQGYSSIAWIERIRRNAQHLISIATHLRHMVGPHSTLLQYACGVGAVRRQLPVRVIAGADIGLSIRIPLNQQSSREWFQLGCEKREKLGAARA